MPVAGLESASRRHLRIEDRADNFQAIADVIVLNAIFRERHHDYAERALLFLDAAPTTF